MTPREIGSWLLGLALPLETARRFALPGFVLACLLALGALWGGTMLKRAMIDLALYVVAASAVCLGIRSLMT